MGWQVYNIFLVILGVRGVSCVLAEFFFLSKIVVVGIIIIIWEKGVVEILHKEWVGKYKVVCGNIE